MIGTATTAAVDITTRGAGLGWLGGVVFDQLGSYEVAWGFAIGLSLLAALANWPIKEAPVGVTARS